MASRASTNHRRWTAEEDALVWDGDIKEVAERLGRSYQSVNCRRYYLTHTEKARKDGADDYRTKQDDSWYQATRHREPWFIDEIEFLVRTMDWPILEVAHALNRTYASIVSKRSEIRK